MSKEKLEERHVVIVGKRSLNSTLIAIVGKVKHFRRWYGGMQLASQLKKSGIPFTLIDNKEYFHHRVGGLRATIFPGKQINFNCYL